MSWNFIPVNGPYLGTSEGPVWDGEYILFTHIPVSYTHLTLPTKA